MARARILVVARDPQTMSDVQDPQITDHHEIEIALSADVAMTILAERKMDALIIDIALTNGDDVTTLKSVKREFPDVPIVAIGDHNTKIMRNRMKKAGADFYMVRPLESGIVTKTVEGALAKSGVLV